MSTKNVTVPAYVALAQKITAALRDLGVPLTEQKLVVDGCPGNKGWAAWQSQVTGHKIYLERRPSGTGIIHTTIAVDPATPGYVDPAGKAPGKIEAFFAASEAEVLGHLVPLFAGTAEPLRADRRPASKAASAPAPRVGSMADVEVPEAARVGSMADLTA
jgi:hypothetical protein